MIEKTYQRNFVTIQVVHNFRNTTTVTKFLAETEAFRRHKNIKLTARKQLKKQYPYWNRLKRKIKK